MANVVQKIGRYELLTQLAIGGMGRVWLARTTGNVGFERHVVIKTLDSHHDASFVTMFLDEARVLGRMHHQHIAPMFELDRDADAGHFLVMEYVHGYNAQAVWDEAVEMNAALPLDFALTVAAAAASALHYAHTRVSRDGTALDVVHRDVSLSNLMIGFDGAIKLIDFGIAKAVDRSTMTQAGYIKGKLGCMAPEQINGGQVDRRTDIFALGVALYEMTTMTRAFRVRSDLETLERIRKGELVAPSKVVPNFPRGLELIIMKALRTDREARFQDADSMRREIEAFGHRQKLILGDSAVVEVMAQLFEDVEPWADLPEAAVVTAVPVEVSNHETLPVDAGQRSVVRNLRAATEMAELMVIEVHSVPDEVDDPGTVRVDTTPPPEDDTTAPMSSTTGEIIISRPVSHAEMVPPNPSAKRPTQPPPSRRSANIPAAAISVATRAQPKHDTSPKSPTSRGRAVLAIGIAAVTVVVVALVGKFIVAGDARPVTAAPAVPVPVAPPIPGPNQVAARPPAPHPQTLPDPTPAPTTEIHLKVTSEPADATVILDGQRLGHTPFEGTVPAASGTHALKLRRRGYTTTKLDITLDNDVSKDIALVLAPPST